MPFSRQAAEDAGAMHARRNRLRILSNSGDNAAIAALLKEEQTNKLKTVARFSVQEIQEIIEQLGIEDYDDDPVVVRALRQRAVTLRLM
ncbi:MAG: hypothetical protein HC828_02075 [Blastochloris sp.]|nr:hypothetical protein [Blastochloris sp.]